MTDMRTYTFTELDKAYRELDQPFSLTRIVDQADKNRIAKKGTGFTEEQVREALQKHLKMDALNHVESRGIYYSLRSFTDDVISTLYRREAETVPETAVVFGEGQVWAKPDGRLYRRHNGLWEQFGTNGVESDASVGVKDLKRVL